MLRSKFISHTFQLTTSKYIFSPSRYMDLCNIKICSHIKCISLYAPHCKSYLMYRAHKMMTSTKNETILQCNYTKRMEIVQVSSATRIVLCYWQLTCNRFCNPPSNYNFEVAIFPWNKKFLWERSEWCSCIYHTDVSNKNKYHLEYAVVSNSRIWRSLKCHWYTTIQFVASSFRLTNIV